MSPDGNGGLTDDSAERLLRDAADGRTVDDPLAAVLRAAAAPARPHELAGYAAVMEAFRDARRTGTGAAVRRAPSRGLLPRLLTVKAVAAAAAVAISGVAVGAGTGVLPNPLRPEPHTTPSPAHLATTPAPVRVVATPLPSGSPAQPALTPSAAPPNLVGLCHAYRRDADHNAARQPEYAALAQAAGDPERVESYCAELLAGRGNGPSAQPSHPQPDPSTRPSHPQPSQAGRPSRPQPSQAIRPSKK